MKVGGNAQTRVQMQGGCLHKLPPPTPAVNSVNSGCLYPSSDAHAGGASAPLGLLGAPCKPLSSHYAHVLNSTTTAYEVATSITQLGKQLNSSPVHGQWVLRPPQLCIRIVHIVRLEPPNEVCGCVGLQTACTQADARGTGTCAPLVPCKHSPAVMAVAAGRAPPTSCVQLLQPRASAPSFPMLLLPCAAAALEEALLGGSAVLPPHAAVDSTMPHHTAATPAPCHRGRAG